MGVTNKLTINQSAMVITRVAISCDFEPEEGKNLFNLSARAAVPLLKTMHLQANPIIKIPEFNPNDTEEQRTEKRKKNVENNIGDINFAIGFTFAQVTEQVAKQYPDNTFVIIDSPTSGTLSNYIGTNYRMREATFLLSSAIAKLFPGEKLGILLPAQFIAPTNEFLYGVLEASKVFGFELVITYMVDINPDSNPDPNYNPFNDPNTARDKAKIMYDDGCRVIFNVAGLSGEGILMEAKSKSVTTGTQHYSIWPDSEGQKTYPDYNNEILGSVLKEAGKSIEYITNKYVTSNLDNSLISLGLIENNSVNSVFNEDNVTFTVTDEILSVLEAEKQKIINGVTIIPNDPNYP